MIRHMRCPIRKSDKYLRGRPDPHITAAKFTDLKDKLARLKKAQPRAAEEVKKLASDGDFSENAAYQIAKGRLRGINQGIKETEEMLARAEIIETTDNEKVGLGNFVTVKSNEKNKTYQILGSTETDPSAGVISSSSPLGSALLGKKIGEKITVKLKDKTIEYEIVKIE
jgi:transcription elongation factor GreA